MKIGLIIYGSLDTLSGGYLYDRRLVETLRAHGDDVQIVSLPWSAYGRHLSHNLSCRLRQQLATANFDLLLQDELNHPSLFWLNGRLRRHSSTPIISIVHHLRSSEQHPAWQMPLYERVERRYLQSVDGYIFNSATTKTTVTAVAGPGRPYVVATPAGDRFGPAMAADDIRRRAQTPGPLRLLFVGNLIPRKGLHTLVAAVAQLPPEAWQLTVVGDTALDPAYTSRIRQQIATAALGSNIVLKGALLGADLAAEYRRSDLLVVPSQYEGFGIVYLEGMGFGLPALATTAGAAGEIVKGGENGYLLAPTAVSTLARVLQQLGQDRRRLLQLSLNARQTFLSWPGWEESMTAVRNFLLTWRY